jgi:AcrR family transcriptional regulator
MTTPKKSRGGRKAKRAPSKALLESEQQILEMRQSGMGISDIARDLGIAKSTAFSRYKSALRRTLAEPAADVRRLDAERLDRLQYAVWTSAMDGDLGAMDKVLKIMERRANLLGLDHRHGIAERELALETGRVRLIAVALSRALDDLGLSVEQRHRVVSVLLTELRNSDGDQILELDAIEDDDEGDEGEDEGGLDE